MPKIDSIVTTVAKMDQNALHKIIILKLALTVGEFLSQVGGQAVERRLVFSHHLVLQESQGFDPLKDVFSASQSLPHEGPQVIVEDVVVQIPQQGAHQLSLREGRKRL